MHAKLSNYQSIHEACKQNPPQTLHEECTQFLSDLDEENTLLHEMQDIKEDERQEAAYIALADRESTLAQKILTDKTLLATKCQTQMAAIIKNDDINSAAFCLLFEENSITLEEYEYLRQYAPRFDNNPQYVAYEKQYAKKKIQEGIKAMNRGDKRAALDAFKAASAANSAEAAYLVGIIYEEKQIKKAITWHKKAIAEGVNLSKVNLARLYLRIKLPNKAREWYMGAAEDNNALAQYRLFKMDAKSKSFKARTEAQVWLDRSANNNYPQAQYIYGLQLLKQKKNEEAQLWLEKAHANGISDTNLFLGKLYFEQEAYDKAYPLAPPTTCWQRCMKMGLVSRKTVFWPIATTKKQTNLHTTTVLLI
jgi:TPR repeat protein